MCGIAGVIMRDGSSPCPAVLEKLERALGHRGPDGIGRRIKGAVGLVHTRLSIIDLKTGAQPLVLPDGSALIANAEIYNYVELRKAMGEAPFSTGSDCETILRLYRRDGPSCVDALRGMFAFALHDPTTDAVLLARDPFGIKPLYYVEDPAFFAFASEPQALVAAGLARAKTNALPLSELLQLGFTTGPTTIFQGISRVLPGESIVLREGRIAERRIRNALPLGKSNEIDEGKALADLDRVLLDSVAIHLRSDVPYGLFLSSGIDSRSILACMSRLGGKVRAYTASFSEGGVADEYAAAQEAAKAFGADHIRVDVTAEDFWTHLPRVVAQLDDPVADAAILPTYLLAREASKDVKVVLCGEGGDELFAGYSRYARQSMPWWLGGRVRRRTGPFSSVDVLRDPNPGWRNGIAAAELAAANKQRSRLQIAQATDCADFLPHGLLTKVDRSLMAHGVEGRTPLLDISVAEFAFPLPQSLKLRHRRGKYLLRQWLSQQRSQYDCFARKKGFTPPYLQWVQSGGLGLGSLVANYPAIIELCYADRVPALFTSTDKQDQEAAWRLLFFALWHRRHVLGRPPDGDVWECLRQYWP